MTWRTVLGIAATLAVGSCSSGNDAAPAVPPAVDTTSASSDDAVPQPSGPNSSDDASSTSPPAGTTGPAPTSTTTTTSAATTTTTFPSAAEQLGLASIEQLTATSGGGSRPILEWAAIDGAAEYHVFVLAPSGTIYWGWQTGGTSVPVGGEPLLDDDSPGPAISDGMTWTVSATDADGQIIALSAHRPISP